MNNVYKRELSSFSSMRTAVCMVFRIPFGIFLRRSVPDLFSPSPALSESIICSRRAWLRESSGTTEMSRTARKLPQLFKCSFSRRKKFHTKRLERKMQQKWEFRRETQRTIDPIHKGVSLFVSYTNMSGMNSLHHMIEHSKISKYLQFESHSSQS